MSLHGAALHESSQLQVWGGTTAVKMSRLQSWNTVMTSYASLPCQRPQHCRSHHLVRDASGKMLDRVSRIEK
jgi:hypothetical protein